MNCAVRLVSILHDRDYQWLVRRNRFHTQLNIAQEKARHSTVTLSVDSAEQEEHERHVCRFPNSKTLPSDNGCLRVMKQEGMEGGGWGEKMSLYGSTLTQGYQWHSFQF